MPGVCPGGCLSFDLSGTLPEDSATPQQISEAVKRELSQVESMIRDLTPSKAEQPTVKQDRTIEDLRNQNL